MRGKIVLITRLGAGAVRAKLPPLVHAVAAAGFGAPVAWVCDPMHGNSRVTSTGIKTRAFEDILAGAVEHRVVAGVATALPPARCGPHPQRSATRSRCTASSARGWAARTSSW